MRKYLKITFIFTALSVLISCEGDDNKFDEVVIDTPSSATESINLSINDDTFFAAGNDIAYTASVSSPKSSDMQILTKGNENIDPATAVSYVNVGDTQSSGNFGIPEIFPAFSFNETGEYSITVSGARLGEISLDEDGEFSSFLPSGENTAIYTSDTKVVTLYDRVPGLDSDGLNILLDWVDPSNNDFDTEVIDANFTNIFESAGSGSRYEGDLFDNTHPDGEFVLYITVFASGGVTDPIPSDVPFRAFFIAPNGAKTIVEGSVPAGTLTNTRTPFVSFTKTGDVYTNIALF